ncbi:MAG: hypothetical protein K8T90_15555 [Planctomycetes bacterium]|nr:hypothetical protein [Planctomycetota bacterium]
MLEIVRSEGPVGAPAVLTQLGEPLALRSLQRILRELQRAGLVAASGKGRATTYRSPESGSG